MTFIIHLYIFISFLAYFLSFYIFVLFWNFYLFFYFYFFDIFLYFGTFLIYFFVAYAKLNKEFNEPSIGLLVARKCPKNWWGVFISLTSENIEIIMEGS